MPFRYLVLQLRLGKKWIYLELLFEVNMITISLCMIVKNESAVLRRCLDSVSSIADEIIIVDTGSTDDTRKIAGKYTRQVYDYSWKDDFADARNFAFSKATMEYIYTADADEMLDEDNLRKFMQLKQALLPEIEIVQMKYITQASSNMVYNAKKELRPKLFRRLRTFTWIDPVHETVRLDPVVYDSDIEILHLPQSMHSSRDFAIFIRAFDNVGTLSRKLIDMYAKELFISGTTQDFMDAQRIFESIYQDNKDADLLQEIACVLAHCYRIGGRDSDFYKLTLKDMITAPCAEMCMEIGEYFYSLCDYEEASIWYYNAAYETGSILTVRSSGDLPLMRLAKCYGNMANQMVSEGIYPQSQIEEYKQTAAEYQELADKWEMPEEL